MSSNNSFKNKVTNKLFAYKSYIPVATLAYSCYTCPHRPLSTSLPNPWSVDTK